LYGLSTPSASPNDGTLIDRRDPYGVLKIRLRRMGAKHQPHYRIVVADARSPRDGRVVESIGFYNPKTQPLTLNVDSDRAAHWLSVGAQPTETVHRLLRRAGVVEGKISTSGEEEGYVTQIPRYGIEPDVVPAYQQPGAEAEVSDSEE
jgi:small subunit ribosomal protein S16